MGADDLFQLLVALAIIFFGLLGGGKRKKKKGLPSTSERAESSRAPSAGRRAPAPEYRAPAAEPRAPTSGRDDLFSEIERILRGQVPEERPVPPPRAPAPDEAYSLESLEGESVEVDAEARHERFHGKYVAPLSQHPVAAPAFGTRPSARLDRIPLRQAIIWREILGPPKGLQ